jgi:2-polyprenyl-3-methyl-5-hydroxy-6-metoxy-1,4-benzoquinol methylase
VAEFDAFADSYQDLVTDSVRISGEPSDYFASYKARYLARVFKGRAKNKVLDYGCGVGSLSKHLRLELRPRTVDGFDPSSESLRSVEPHLRQQGLFTDTLSDLREDYDLVVLANVLHHVLPADREKLLTGIYSRLRVGGILAVFEHNPYNPLTRWAVSQCSFDEDAILLHNSEVRHRLQKIGFQLFRRDFIVFFPKILSFLRPLEPLLGWCPLGAQHSVLGVKSLSHE